jgi:hypothetical protein
MPPTEGEPPMASPALSPLSSISIEEPETHHPPGPDPVIEHAMISELAYKIFANREHKIALTGNDAIAARAFEIYEGRTATGGVDLSTFTADDDWTEALNELGCVGNSHTDWATAEEEFFSHRPRPQAA